MDPVARYYAAKPGDVFRIIRPSPFAGMAFHYRQVIDSNVKILYDK
jgi:DNA-directed RNA polymerase subunit H (RpoH/RPB5)